MIKSIQIDIGSRVYKCQSGPIGEWKGSGHVRVNRYKTIELFKKGNDYFIKLTKTTNVDTNYLRNKYTDSQSKSENYRIDRDDGWEFSGFGWQLAYPRGRITDFNYDKDIIKSLEVTRKVYIFVKNAEKYLPQNVIKMIIENIH